METRKMERDKLLIIVLTVLFLLTACVIAYYAITVDDEIFEVTREKMEENSVSMGLEIEKSINESEEDLRLLAEYAMSADIDFDNAVEFLCSQSQVEEFEKLYYIDYNAQGISTDGDRYDFSDNRTFLDAMRNEFYIEAPHISQETGSIVFDIAVPVSKNGIITGALLSEIAINDLYEIMDDTVTGGWIFLVDYDLDIFFTSSLGHADFDSVPPSDIEALGVENVEKGVVEAENGNSGSFAYVANYGSGNTKKILSYAPIKNTDWVIVIAIEESAINIDLETAVNHITNICIVIWIIISIFVAHIWTYRHFSIRSIEKSKYYDKLTDLPNLAKVKKDMKDVLKKNKEEKYSVVKIDVENFKAINEMFGYEIGNQVLQAFKQIRETVHEPSLLIARIGVDEFLLFAGNGFLDNLEERTSIYESYYHKFIPKLANYEIRFKYGRYHIPIGNIDVDDIMNKVNLAHRIAKESKDLLIYDYDEIYSQKLLKEAEITSKMHDALRNHEFEVYLQPKFNLDEGLLIGAEALVRWREKNGNLVFPNEFIPLFERNGFIVELDRYVLKCVCSTIRKWFEEGRKPITISVNCSRCNLLHKNFVSEIGSIVDLYSVPHEYIEIELTETITIENKVIIADLFAELKDAGFKISIDDFGAGYSSLSLLKNLKADTLKMDRSFFNEKDEIVRAEYVVDGFVKLSHNLDMYVVAEGIETEEQIEALKKLSCDAVQGYYYSKPIPIFEFEEKYKEYM